MCATNGWEFDAVKLGPIDGDEHVAGATNPG
jgi:hypothetical protein